LAFFSELKFSLQLVKFPDSSAAKQKVCFFLNMVYSLRDPGPTLTEAEVEKPR